MSDPFHHFWIVAGDETRVWSSANGRYVPADDPGYLAWGEARSEHASRIANEFELDQVLRQQGLSLGRAIAAEEALQALASIDVGKVRTTLGREAVTALEEGDADKLLALAIDLQPEGIAPPNIEGSVVPKPMRDELAELTARFDELDAALRAREAELVGKGALTPS